MNEHSVITSISSADTNPFGSPNGDVGTSSPVIRQATSAALHPNADVPNADDEDPDDATTTGLNPDPDYEKLAGAAELVMPDDASDTDDDDLLSSDDTDDDRV